MEGTNKRILPIAVAVGINTLAYSIIYPFLPIYLHSIRKIPMHIVGLVFPAMGLAAIIGAPLAGALADRIGRRKLLVGGPIGRSACFFGLAYMAHVKAPFWAFVLLLSLAALVGTFFRNAANAYVTDLTPAEKRTSAFSTLRIGLNVGWMTGPAIGAFLAQTPFALLFSLTAGLCMVTMLIVLRFCPPVEVHKAPRTGKRLGLLAMIKADHHLMLLMGMSLLLFLTTSQFVSTLTVFAKEELGVGKNWLGLLYTLNGAIVIVFQMPLNRLLDRWSLDLRMAAGALLYVVAYIGIGMSGRWAHLAICIGILTIGEIFTVTAILAAVSHLAAKDRVGRYMGAFGLVQGLGWALGPFFGSLLFEPLRSRPMFLWGILSAGAAVSAIGFLIAGLRKKYQQSVSG